MKKIGLLTAVVLVSLSIQSAFACFDTYCLMRRQSMVYPKGLVALEGNGEFVAQKLDQTQEDLFTGNLNAYYGVAERFSVQGSLISDEKPRNEFEIDHWAVRGVYGLYTNGGYSLDAIMEHNVSMIGGKQTLELSAPSIFHFSNSTVVVHPVLAMGNQTETGVRGHGGFFYHLGNSIVGLGAEYESAQSSSNMSRRLIKGEAGTSLFLGSALGPNMFLQNELIKGWGADSKDIGFAATIKFLIPTK